jgi:hypothetical protein
MKACQRRLAEGIQTTESVLAFCSPVFLAGSVLAQSCQAKRFSINFWLHYNLNLFSILPLLLCDYCRAKIMVEQHDVL